MPYLSLGFTAAWLILFGLTIRQMKETRKEMAFLPPLPTKAAYNKPRNLSVGMNISRLLPIVKFDHPYTVFSVTLPGCSFCHSAIESFLDSNKTVQLNHVNLLAIEGESQEATQKFLDLYKGAFTIVQVRNEVIQSLLINSFPTFLLVDETGEIIHETGWSKGTLIYYRKLTKKK